MTKAVIIGAGAHAREILDVFDAINAQAATYEVLGYIVETEFGTPDTVVNEIPILGDFDWFNGRTADVQAICAVGAPELRYRLVQRARASGIRFCKLTHPSAVVTRWVELGEGSVVTAGCILTNRIRVGAHVHINIGCTVSHDSVLEDFVTLAPGVHSAGGVVFRQGCNLGVGCSVGPRREIGAWSIVGAGTVLIEDVPANSTVSGVPGVVRRTRPSGWHLHAAEKH